MGYQRFGFCDVLDLDERLDQAKWFVVLAIVFFGNLAAAPVRDTISFERALLFQGDPVDSFTAGLGYLFLVAAGLSWNDYYKDRIIDYLNRDPRS